jgi:hypothetical protein
MDQADTVQSVTEGQPPLRWLYSFIGAASCWWLAYSLYLCWHLKLTPETGRWLPPAGGLFVLEFILVHSGAMLPMLMAARKLQPMGVKPVLLVSGMYVLFAIAITLSFKSWQLLSTFSGIMIPRWMGLVQDSDGARQQQINRSSESVIVFFFCAVVFLVFLQMPFDAVLAIYFASIGLLEITSPMRTKNLLQTPVMGFLVLIIFAIGLGFIFFRPFLLGILKGLHHH